MPITSEAAADVAIIGAGPAGLTAAYLLTAAGYSVVVIEKDPVYVGGISRTVEHNGFRFDIGGHRFFSKSREVVDLWNEILPNDFIQRPRMSRIFYDGKFYSYPLKLDKIGYFNSLLFPLAVADRVASKVRGKDDADVRLPSRPLNAALEAVFASERHFVGRLPLPPGLSLFAVASAI